MDTAKGCLPQPLSLTRRVPGPSLAARRAGRCLDRNTTRYLLPWLLLAINGFAVRRRTDEPRLDCCDRTLGAVARDDSVGRRDAAAVGNAVHLLGHSQFR